MRAVAVAALIVLAAADAVSAQPALSSSDAQAHMDAGLALYDRGDYDAAIVQLEAAYRLDPAPPLVFAIAQAKRLAGHCDEALPMYEHYLATQPGPAQVRAAQTGIAMCNDDLAAREQDRAVVAVTPLDNPVPVEPTARPGRGWRITAVISGIATAAAAGTWLYSAAKVRELQAKVNEPQDLATLTRLDAEGERYSKITYIVGPAVVVGSALCAAAIYKGFISPPREAKRLVVTPTVSADGAGAAMSLSW